MSRSLLLALAMVAACKGGGSDATEPSDTTPDPGFLDGLVPVLVADASAGVAMPSDIEFQPTSGIAFITNRADDSIVLLHTPDAEDPQAERRGGEDDVVGSNHFLAKPSGLAFADNGDWASIHMEDKRTQGIGGTPADFMGPTLWTGDLSDLDAGHASHLDMLHSSPNGAGIAWQSDNAGSNNAYFVFDGQNSAITYYDFKSDHGLGGADHSDGVTLRYIDGEVSFVEDIVSHLVYDNGLLYIADTGNNRILALDTTTGTLGNPLEPNYDGLGRDKFNYMDGAEFWELIDTSAAGMEAPAGLELHDGVLYASDHAQGELYAFDLASGELLDTLDLGQGANAVQGMGIDGNGTLWFVNDATDEVYKLVAE